MQVVLKRVAIFFLSTFLLFNVSIHKVQSAAPVADFSAEPTVGEARFRVKFTDLSTNNPTSWLWEFGDGKTSSERNPTNRYDNPGLYTVSLTAQNADGTHKATKANYIHVTSKPSVKIKKPASASCAGGTVLVEAEATDVDGTIQSVSFDYSLDAGKTWDNISTDSNSPYSVNWNVSITRF